MLSGKSFNCEFYVTISTEKSTKMTKKIGKNKKIRGVQKSSLCVEFYQDILCTSFWDKPNNQTLDFLANFLLIGEEATNAVKNLFKNIREIIMMTDAVMFKHPNHDQSLHLWFDKNHEVLLKKLLRISTQFISKISIYDMWSNQYIKTIFKTLAIEPKQESLMIEILNFMNNDIIAAINKLNLMNIPIILTGIEKSFITSLPVCLLDCLSISCVGDIDTHLLYNLKSSGCFFRKLELLNFDTLDLQVFYSKYQFDFVEEIEISLHPWFIPQLRNGLTFFKMVFPNAKKITMTSVELMHPNVEAIAIIRAIHEAGQQHINASISTLYHSQETQWLTCLHYGQQIEFIEECDFIWVDPTNDGKTLNVHVHQWKQTIPVAYSIEFDGDMSDFQVPPSLEF